MSKLYFILIYGVLTNLGLCVFYEILKRGLRVPLSFKIADRVEMFLTIMVPLIAIWLFRFVLKTDDSILYLLAMALMIFFILLHIFSLINESVFGYRFPESMPKVR